MLERAEEYLSKGVMVEDAKKYIAQYKADLAVPPFPISLIHVWRAYNRLRRRKNPGFSSFAKIEWPDIDAFLRRSGVRLRPWEVVLLEDLDDVFLKAMRMAEEGTPEENAAVAAAELAEVGKRPKEVKRG